VRKPAVRKALTVAYRYLRLAQIERKLGNPSKKQWLVASGSWRERRKRVKGQG